MKDITNYRTRNVIAVFAFIIVLIFNSLFTLKRGSDERKEQSLEQMTEYTESMAAEIVKLVRDNQDNIMGIISSALTLEADFSDERLEEVVDSFPSSGTISAIKILLPDNRMIWGKGDIRYFEGITFDEEIRKGVDRLDRWMTDTRDPNIAYCRHPIVVEDQAVAILYGVMDLNNLAETLRKQWIGDSEIFIFKRETGEFLLDTMHGNLVAGVINNNLEYRIGIEDNEKIKKNLQNGVSGVSRAFSVENQDWMYISYAEVGIEDWVVMISMSEKQVLQDYYDLIDIIIDFMVLTGIVGIAMVIWLLYSRKLRNLEWIEEMSKEEEARKQLENILDTMSSGVIRSYADAPYEVITINPAGLQLFAVDDLQEFIHRRGNGRLVNTMMEEDAQELIRKGDELLKKQWDTFTTECRIKHDDGSVRIVELTTTLIVPADGKNRPILQRICRDITKDLEVRRMKEIQVRDRYLNQMFIALTGSTEDVFVIFSVEDYSVKFVSPNAYRMLGIPKEEIYRDIGTLVQEDAPQTIGEIVEELKELTEGYRKEDVKRIHKRTGEERWFQERSYPTKLGNERCVLHVMSDRTSEIQKQEMMQSALENARAANQSKSAFLSDMSHDLRTPMNAISGLVELLKSDIGKPEKANKHLEQMSQSTRHMLDLVNNILDMSRIESGRTELNNHPFCLRDVFKEVLDICKSQAQYKEQTVNETVNLFCDKFVGDPVRLRMILINLVNNAVKYTPNGGTLNLTAKSRKPNRLGRSKITIIIQDNGVGMSEEFMKDLFTPYAREANTTMSGEVGTGLGLPIVKNLVELMGGIIKVDSKKGVGSTFTIELKLKVVDEEVVERAEAEKNAEDYSSLSLSGLRFLVVEDNEINAEVLMELLALEGAQCEHAENGKVGMEMFLKAEPEYYDAILMDIQMPILNGYETTRIIRGSGHPSAKSVPILAMTANTFAEDVQAALDAGMNVHLAKPVKVETLKKNLLKLEVIDYKG